jgi:hypothetical protein
MIVTDTSRMMLQIVATLTIVIYNRKMFIVEASEFFPMDSKSNVDFDLKCKSGANPIKLFTAVIYDFLY